LWGISEPTASQLAALEWVTPDYIEAHVLSLAEHETRGLAIIRMRAGEAPPGWVKRGGRQHIREAKTAVEGWQPDRYSRGSFTDYIRTEEP